MPKYYKKVVNDSDLYEEIFEQKEVDRIIQHAMKFFNKSIKNTPIRITRHTWKQGDKLYKLAGQYYNNPRFWWVIAVVNKISSEADLTYGQIIKIPLEANEIVGRI